LRNRLERLAVSAPARADSSADIEGCVREADRLLATFNALLRIARIESGAYRAAFADVDLAGIAEDVCEFYRPAAEDRNVSLLCRAAAPAWIFGDRDLLAQAVTNLLDNAIKYTPPGGQVEVVVEPGPRSCRLAVSDTGPGIPREEIDNVQRRFVRLDAARSEPGNGLGLALVRAVVEQHRGSLAIENTHPGLRITMEIESAAGPGGSAVPGSNRAHSVASP
jgi:signal transduction histidine kinase